jgi:ATP-binding cassette subfamily B (MDR/TAP) protein 1
LGEDEDGSPQSVKTKTRSTPMLTTKFALVFKHADAVDVALMVVGLVGAIGDGMSTPVMLAITSRVFDDAGSGPDHLQQFVPKMNEVRSSSSFHL